MVQGGRNDWQEPVNLIVGDFYFFLLSLTHIRVAAVFGAVMLLWDIPLLLEN